MPVHRHYKWEAWADTLVEQFKLDRPPVVAVDTETTGFTWQDRPFGMTVAWPWYPQGTLHDPEYRVGWFELGNDHALDQASWMLDDMHDRGVLQVYYNAKFDLRMLHNEGLIEDTPKFTDALPMVALLNPAGLDEGGGKGLKLAARKYLGMSTNEERRVKEVRDKLQIPAKSGYHVYPREVIVPYALKDALFTYWLYEMLPRQIREEGLQEAFDKDLALVSDMLLMERRGLKTLPDVAREEIKTSDKIIAEARANIEQMTGLPVGDGKETERIEIGVYKNGNIKYKVRKKPVFNPNSGPQKLAYFKTQGIKLKNTQKKTLEKLDHPLVPHLITLSQEEKLRGTYLVPLVKEADKDNILHPNFNQWGTSTGRFSSSAARET